MTHVLRVKYVKLYSYFSVICDSVSPLQDILHRTWTTLYINVKKNLDTQTMQYFYSGIL